MWIQRENFFSSFLSFPNRTVKNSIFLPHFSFSIFHPPYFRPKRRTLKKENGLDLCTAIPKMSHLWSLQIKATSEEEVLNLQSMPSPPPLLQSLGLHGRLEKWPEWIPKLKSIASISLKRSNLMEDPLKVLQALPNLMSLKLHDGYRGDQLHIEGGGFQKLNYLGLLHLERLNRLMIDEGALPLLEKLEIGDCPQLKEVLSGIHHMNCQLNSFLVCNQMKALILGKSSIFPLSLSVIGLMDKTAIGTRLVIQNC